MNRIKDRREELRYLQKDVAEQLGIKTPQYQRYESGKTLPSVFMAKKISNVLDVSLSTFTNWLEQLHIK